MVVRGFMYHAASYSLRGNRMGHFGILQPVVLLGRWGLGKVKANIL